MDTLIAATALEYGSTLVTTDSDFTRFPALSLRLLPPGTPAPYERPHRRRETA
jgi:hypothetical protein